VKNNHIFSGQSSTLFPLMLQNSGGERLTIFVCGFIKIKERFGSQGLGSVYFKVKCFSSKNISGKSFFKKLVFA
jgi:hypothetical protein